VLTARRRDPTSPELPTVIELLLSSGLADAERFSHVGRLDVASEGLLLLTTDGQLTARMIDPAHGCRKTYLAVARGRGRPGSRARIHAGASAVEPARSRTHAHTAPTRRLRSSLRPLLTRHVRRVRARWRASPP